IPERLLKKGGLIQHAELLFNVEVVRYMVNSAPPAEPAAGAANPANAGDGLKVVPTEQPEATKEKVDLASAYVTFKKKTGEPIGPYLVPVWFSLLNEHSPYQQVEVDGKKYDVTLRWKRTYKPYTVPLLEFRHDLYPGTSVPKNFSSRVRLVDHEHGDD